MTSDRSGLLAGPLADGLSRQFARALGALLLGALLHAAPAAAEAVRSENALGPADSPPVAGAPTVAPLPAGVRDCSRWPASVYEETSGSCVCPSNMWWNLRGDACLPREHAAAEFCSTVWPSSSPYLMSGGGYRCVCAPPLMWNEQATACRPPAASVEMDCTSEWPGTLPVLSPSGTEYECRCPGGRRWEEASRSCVAGAPVVAMGRSYGDEPGVGPGTVAPPPQAPVFPPSPPPTAGSGAIAPPGAGAGTLPSRPIPGAGTADSAECAPLISEIRMRAQAGQTAEADALGMKAAIAGCDPAAIADAARVKSPR